MERQNDISMYIVVGFLIFVVTLWALVHVFDGTRLIDVSETSISFSQEGGQNG